MGHNQGSFIAGRVIAGYVLPNQALLYIDVVDVRQRISTALYQVTASPLIAEIAHPRIRAVSQASFYGTYFVGAFTAGWIGYGGVTWASDWSWRIVSIFQCLGCIPVFVWSLTPWMVESPRWLVKQGRHAEAIKILADLHANGDQTDELVTHEMAEIVAGVESDGAIKQGNVFDFFKTPGNRKRLWATVWFAWALSMSGVRLSSPRNRKVRH